MGTSSKTKKKNMRTGTSWTQPEGPEPMRRRAACRPASQPSATAAILRLLHLDEGVCEP